MDFQKYPNLNVEEWRMEYAFERFLGKDGIRRLG